MTDRELHSHDDESGRRVPWLEFAIHHREGGLMLAAEATLRGSLAVLMGPSGSGKTSLLRSIAGLLRPRSGHVTVAGKAVWTSEAGVWRRPSARGCGLVMQRPALFPAMTVAGNITFGLHAIPRAERERRVEEMAELFRLQPLLWRRPVQLSGGEQQRVSVARALAPHPQVLLLDEPFAGLNQSLKDAILTDLESWLKRTGTPMLHVTHDVAEAWRLGSRPGCRGLAHGRGPHRRTGICGRGPRPGASAADPVAQLEQFS